MVWVEHDVHKFGRGPESDGKGVADADVHHQHPEQDSRRQA